MTYAVILSCFFLIYVFFTTQDANVKLLTLLGSLVIFSGGMYFTLTPVIAPMHIPLYGFLAYALVLKKSHFSEELSAFPLKMGLSLLFITFLLSGFFGSGGGIHGAFTAIRFFLDSYGFILVAYLIAYQCDYKKITDMLYWPILIFCAFGFIEAVLKYNYVYAILMDSFPEYSGLLEKGNPNLNFHDSWRIRTSITTMHPTTLGALLTMLFILYLPRVKERVYKNYFLMAVLALAIYLSGSRSAWVCTAMYLVFYIVKSQSALVKMFFLFFLLVGIGYVGHSFVESFSADDQGSSLDMRQRNLLVCLVSFAGSPIVGHGFNYMSNLVERYDNGSFVDGAMESVFFNLMVEQGTLGLLSYFGFVLLCLLMFHKLKQYDSTIAEIGSGITMMITIFSLMSGTLGNLHSMSYIFVGACLGMLCAKKEEAEENVVEDETSEDSV